jgi:hypothetical protein
VPAFGDNCTDNELLQALEQKTVTMDAYFPVKSEAALVLLAVPESPATRHSPALFPSFFKVKCFMDD